MTVLPVFIDIEASGFGHQSYPIEIGVAFSDGSQYSSLIKPAPHWQYWDPHAETLHGIDRHQLLHEGVSASTVTAELNARLAGQTVYSDGWVVDKPWLDQLFRAANRNPDFWLSPVELILSEAQMENWRATRATLIQTYQGCLHRAAPDALLNQLTWQALGLGA